MPPATRFTLATGDPLLLRDRDDRLRDDPLFRAELLRVAPPDDARRFVALRDPPLVDRPLRAADERLRDEDDFRADPPDDEPLRFVAPRDAPPRDDELLFRAELLRFVALRDEPDRDDPPREDDDFRAEPPDDLLREDDFRAAPPDDLRAELPPARLPPVLLLDPARPPPDALRERPELLFRALPPLLPDRPLLRADVPRRVDFDAVAMIVLPMWRVYASLCKIRAHCCLRNRKCVCAIGNAARSVQREAHCSTLQRSTRARRATLPSIPPSEKRRASRVKGRRESSVRRRRVMPHTARGRARNRRFRILTCS